MQILFENNDFLVINKPAGLVVHGDGKTNKPTVVDWVLEQYPALKRVGESATFNDEEIDRPGIVHRLDEETSGALLIAKTSAAFAHFKQQFMERKVEKEYHAFVWGWFKESEGVVNVPIGRSADPRRRLAGRGARGELREAITKWQAVHQFTDATGEQFSFMHLFPKTGRTHQLRVHMKYLQRPIVSDHVYANTMPDALGFIRLALHARKITFMDQHGMNRVVEAPYPEDFSDAVAKYVKE
jgi:23S rRNA pseudouridine1911/1915/1917 synthase